MKKAGLMLIGLVLMAISFVYGVREGGDAVLGKEAKFRASMAAYYLGYIDENKIDGLRESLDTDLDFYLIQHMESQDSIVGAFFPELEDPDERSLQHAAMYRLANPNNTFSEEFLSTLEDDVAAYYRSVKPHFDALLQKYGQ